MTKILCFIAAVAFGAVASAAGLPYAVQPLAKAKALAKSDGRHLLIFYTSTC